MEKTEPFLLRKPRSVDDFVIRTKTWAYMNAKGERVVGPLIDLHRPGVLSINDN